MVRAHSTFCCRIFSLYVYPSDDVAFVVASIIGQLEVLETTRNFTEAALKRGGFYSPEGFPFQKHVTSRSSAWAMPTLA
jgi:hypothetical protein